VPAALAQARQRSAGKGPFKVAETSVYIGRRLIQLLIVIWIAGTVNFVVPRMIPGDPVESAFNALAIGGGRQSVDVQALKVVWNEKFGFDKPLITQYINYWGAIAAGDLGISVVSYPQRVSDRIGAAIPWTLGLLLVSSLIAFLLGTLAGALLAWPSSPRFIRPLVAPFIVLSAIPFYLLAILLIFIFSASLGLLPGAGGSGPTTILGWNLKSALDIASHSILPALAIVLGGIGFWALGMRSLMVNVLGEDYITFAESKGLQPSRVFLRYGLRNALLAQVTALALVLGTLVSGAVLVEAIFSYPGLGGLLTKAILGKDIFVINGVVMLLILTLGISVFVVDMLYPVLDPRIRRRR
jgi:peptide/nickel transport system permease protein